jgi:hypothetical protein
VRQRHASPLQATTTKSCIHSASNAESSTHSLETTSLESVRANTRAALICADDCKTSALCNTKFCHICKKRNFSARPRQHHSIPTSYESPLAIADTMSQPGFDDYEDPFYPGEQCILPGEQSSGTVAGGTVADGSGSGNGDGNGGGSGHGSSMDITDGTREAREANLATFRSSLGARGLQYDSQVFYDTTPGEEASPVYGGMEGYEVSYEVNDESGGYQDGCGDAMGEEDEADQDRYNNEVSEQYYDNEVSEDNRAYQEDDNNHNEVSNASFLAFPAQGGSPSDPPSGSEYDGDEDRFAARLAGALQDAADNGEVEIADSQAGSEDDLDNTADHKASWSWNDVKTEEDSQTDLDDFQNIPTYAASSSDQEMADSQAGSYDLGDNTANQATPWTELEVADSQADSEDLEDNTANHVDSSSDQEMADPRADSDDPDTTANHAALWSDVKMEDSQDDSSDLDNNVPNHADSSSEDEISDSQADSDDLEINANEAASSSDQEVSDSQADSDDPVVRSHTYDSDDDSDADTIVPRQRGRQRLAPVRTLKVPHDYHNPDNDPDSSSSDGNSDSSLSDLDKTPVPEDPVLLRLEREFKLRTLKRCMCLGWCNCTSYSKFYGSGGLQGPGPPVIPSQTHLSEAALANMRFPISAIRSTIAAEERYEERRERSFSLDRKRRPVLPPVGWVGGEWSEFPENYKPASVEEADDAGD